MTDRYRPNTTVAWIVASPKGYLFVEEFKQGMMRFNQPAGHIEAGETLIDAAIRELYEETSLEAKPAGLVGIYQFPSQEENTSYIRFCFYLELDEAADLRPIDSDIHACHWLTREQIGQKSVRSQFVLSCLDDYRAGQRFPLSVLTCQNHPL